MTGKINMLFHFSSFNGYQRFCITFGNWMTSLKMANKISRNLAALWVLKQDYITTVLLYICCPTQLIWIICTSMSAIWKKPLNLISLTHLPCNVQYRKYVQDANLDIIVPADGLAPSGTRPYASTVMSEKLNLIHCNPFRLAINLHQIREPNNYSNWSPRSRETWWNLVSFWVLTHLPLVPHICVSELGCHWYHWRWTGDKPLPEPMLVYSQLNSWEQVSVKFEF